MEEVDNGFIINVFQFINQLPWQMYVNITGLFFFFKSVT